MVSENLKFLTIASTFFVRFHSNDIMITTSEIIITETEIPISLSLKIYLLII